MNEKEMIEKLGRELVFQIEEKVKMTRWSFQFLSDIDKQLSSHFENNRIRPERKTFP